MRFDTNKLTSLCKTNEANEMLLHKHLNNIKNKQMCVKSKLVVSVANQILNIFSLVTKL